MNKFEERRLRRVIAEAAASAFVKRNQRSKRRLQSIFEDVGQDIKTAFKGGPGAVRSFVDSAKDKEGLKAALKGDFDGETEDDVVTKGGGNPTVGSLLPTQSEIDLVKSIGWPLGDLTTLEKMIKSGTSTAPGAITVSGNLILDGHHRWSGVWSISGPSGKVAVDDLKIPGSTSQKLAASQLAIAAYKDAGAQQPSASDPIDLNILGKSPDEIEKDILAAEGQKDPDAPGAILNPQYLKACSESDTVAAWAGFKVGDDAEKVKAAIAKKTASNLAGLPKNPDAPARADMPQFDAKSIGGKAAKKAIFAGLEKGEYNIEPPFKPGDEEPSKDEKKQQTSGYRRDGHVVVERWQRLAGIIKG